MERPTCFAWAPELKVWLQIQVLLIHPLIHLFSRPLSSVPKAPTGMLRPSAPLAWTCGSREKKIKKLAVALWFPAEGSEAGIFVFSLTYILNFPNVCNENYYTFRGAPWVSLLS